MIINYLFGKILVLLFFALCAVIDFKYKHIDIIYIIIMLLIEVVIYSYMLIFKYNINFVDIAIGMIVGSSIVLFAKITKETIGMGDGLVLIVLGIATGGHIIFGLLIFASLGICFYGLIIGLTKRLQLKNYKNIQVPFLPFFVPALIYICMVV